MDIDEDIAKTAWYKLGPKPGEKGSAVIAGHYGRKDGQESVFSNLHSLQRGDTVSVYDDKGVGLDFIVKEIRKYNFDADATEVFRSSDGKAHLNLITCDGPWNNALRTYSDRLVVFTDLKLQ
jgi:LPXTG-site transpeptidase (sortase) family protein